MRDAFALEEPPTTPHRSPSGAPIKIAIIRAIARQQEAEAEASHALDGLVRSLRRAIDEGSLRPPKR